MYTNTIAGSLHRVHGHEINEVNMGLRLDADEPTHGNASHNYWIVWTDKDHDDHAIKLPFHCGPIKEVGVNGITHEALLTIIKDRLTGFQSSEWACPENQAAIDGIDGVLAILAERTKKRDERGVEGTWEK